MRPVPLGFSIALCITSLFVSPMVSAALYTRLGGLAVYDSDLDITWLANANAGAGSIYDDGSNTVDGRMTWANANNWASSLIFGGSENWRLANMDVNGDGIIVDCASVGAAACLDNEYGYQFYYNGINTNAQAPFNSIQTNNYWSETAAGSSAWLFDFNYNDGSQLTTSQNYNAYAWAVMDGDISNVPLPAAFWFFGSGLLGISLFARRRPLSLHRNSIKPL